MNIKGYIKNEYFLLTTLILAGILGRIILVGYHLQPFPNFEIIMVITFLAAIIIRSKIALLVPFFSMFLSDIILGNNIFIGYPMNRIVIFTYSAFIFLAFISYFKSNWFKHNMIGFTPKSIILSGSTGLIFTLIYDIWTNFGWWYLLYPHTSETFIGVLIAGIPFMIYHMLSNIFMFIVVALPIISYLATYKSIHDKITTVSTKSIS